MALTLSRDQKRHCLDRYTRHRVPAGLIRIPFVLQNDIWLLLNKVIQTVANEIHLFPVICDKSHYLSLLKLFGDIV